MRHVLKVTNGVLGFAWSEMFRVMVSIGVERGPLAWNPFTKSTVTTLDAGHASIVSVTLDEHRQRIISVDAMNHIFVHSLKDFKLLQEVHQHPEHPGGAFLADDSRATLLSSGNDKQKSEEMDKQGCQMFYALVQYFSTTNKQQGLWLLGHCTFTSTLCLLI